MLLGRKNELQYLNTIYQKAGSQMIVVYGQKNVGKTTLLKEFIKDKSAFFYTAMPASTRQQQYMLAGKVSEKPDDFPEYPTYETIMTVLESFPKIADKKIYVFDEWEHMIKTDTAFMNTLIQLLHHAYSENDAMIILCSSSVGFVENGLVSKIGKMALDITGFLKVKELKFVDLIRAFPNYSAEDCVKIYSILGGVPGLWNYFEAGISVEKNICKHILQNGCFLQEEGARFVKEELRETAVYYTILSALAQGMHKLNELYVHTGFSRAKISVYLKNLMELEIVEKVFSVDTQGRDNLKKGVYRISNSYVLFWFKYIYPNFGDCLTIQPKDFYSKYISKDLKKFCEGTFSQIVREYMMMLDASGKLPFKCEKTGLFDGKEGTVDFVGQGDSGESVVAFADFSKPMITYEDYKHYMLAVSSAKLKPDQIYLFSGGRFDEKLTLESKVKGNVILLGMDDL